MDDFQGEIAHPQEWREGLDYAGKRVVIIGSGATAVTMAPALAEQAAQVTMLQRSPTYIVSGARRDELALRMQAALPFALAAKLSRWRHILISMFQFYVARSRPEDTRQSILDGARAQLGDGFDVETHFNPPYKPWDQRVCLVPDGDFFSAMRQGKLEVVTDHIAQFEQKGIRLESGALLEADLVITATGLIMALDARHAHPGRWRGSQAGRNAHLQGRDVQPACPTWSRCSATPTPPGHCAPSWSANLSVGC